MVVMSIQPAGTKYCHSKRIKSSDAKLKSSVLSSRILLGWLASAGQLLLAHVYVQMLTISHTPKYLWDWLHSINHLTHIL